MAGIIPILMLKIKLARFGKRGQPHYRIVVTEQRSKRDGQYLEAIGTYAPTQTPKELNIDTAAYKQWMTKGAQPTPTVAYLYSQVSGEKKPAAKTATPKKTAPKKATAQAA